MLYNDGAKMNEDLKVIEACPRCENEELSGEAGFCKICGLSLYNYCLTQCHKNNSNSRFCEICGNPTIFFEENVLLPWEEIKK